MKRRDFIHNSIHTAAGASLFGHFAQEVLNPNSISKWFPANPNNDHVLIIIFLNGGNDTLNTVVPLSQMDTLNTLRPHVVLNENKVIKIPGTELGLHPSLSGLSSLLDQGKLKIIRGVGYPDQNYSHFRSSDIWMSGADSEEVLSTGWMGRYLNTDYPEYPTTYPNAIMPDPLSLELGYSNSLLFQGPVANMSVVINGERDFYQLVEDNIGDVPNTLYGDRLAHVKLVRRQSQVYGTTIKSAADKVNQQFTGYPQTSIAQQLKICARLIAGGLRTPVYKVEIGGFDTHAGQVDPNDHSKGVHSDLLRQLDEAIIAFMEDLKFLNIEDKVTGMTFSEFGRRIVSNSSNGTDHGSAGPIFVFGKHVDGGILGDDYDLDPAMTFEDNLDFQFDFRQVYGTMLNQWLCINNNDIDAALLDEYVHLPIMSPSACVGLTDTRNQYFGKDLMKIWPNPVKENLNIEYESDGNPLIIDLISINGQHLRNLVQGKSNTGSFSKSIKLDHLAPGTYFIRYKSRLNYQTKVMIKS